MASGLQPQPSRFPSWRNKQGRIYRGQATPAVLTRATWTGSSRSPSSNPKIHRYPGKSMANPDPAGKSIHPILPQDVSRPITRRFNEKNPEIRGLFRPRFSDTGRRPRSQTTRRTQTFETFSNVLRTHANLHVAHQAKKRRRGCVQRKNFVKSRPRSAPSQKTTPGVRTTKKSPFQA